MCLWSYCIDTELVAALIGAAFGFGASWLTAGRQIRAAIATQLRPQLADKCATLIDAARWMVVQCEIQVMATAPTMLHAEFVAVILKEHRRFAISASWIALFAPARIRSAVGVLSAELRSSLVDTSGVPPDGVEAVGRLKHKFQAAEEVIRSELGVTA